MPGARFSRQLSPRKIELAARFATANGGRNRSSGKGAMLFLPPASSRFIGCTGPTSPSRKSARLARHPAQAGQPVYGRERLIRGRTSRAVHGIRDGEDDLYDRGRAAIVRGAGAGRLDLRILPAPAADGFSARPARLVDMMRWKARSGPLPVGRKNLVRCWSTKAIRRKVDGAAPEKTRA